MSTSPEAAPAAPTKAPATEAPKKPTELAVVEDTSAGAINAFGSASAFATAQRIATALAQSTMVPAQYQGNVPNCLIAIELASRIGASVFAVMQSMDIIHGRPGWRATFLIATVNASRRFTPIRYRWEGKAGSPEYGCRAVAKDVETGEECIGALISWGMVRAEGWDAKSGSKWKTMPEQMFMYRAAGFWTRVYAPEMSMGLRTAEEEQDIIDVAEVPRAAVAVLPVPGVEAQGQRMSLGKPKDAKPSKVEPAPDPLPARRAQLIKALGEAMMLAEEVCQPFGKQTLDELTAAEVEQAFVQVQKITGEVST